MELDKTDKIGLIQGYIGVIILTIIFCHNVSAIYPGETVNIDMQGKFINISNCSSNIPLNYSINNVILTITIPTDFEGNLSLTCSGWNDVSTHTTTTERVEVPYYAPSGGSSSKVACKNTTIYQNQTVEKIIYLNNQTAPVPATDGKGIPLWLVLATIVIVLGLILAMWYYLKREDALWK